MSANLQAWRDTWSALGAPADEELHRRLIERWSEPHRRYHALAHLESCLARFDTVRTQVRRPGEVALGLWFHDAIYEPRRHDNEERSAQWARDSVLRAGLPEDVASRVEALVMATRHEAVPTDADARVLVDIDLSSLGDEPAQFDAADAAIGEEYAHVPPAEFKAGRRAVLEGFLARPRIFATEHFHALYEERARENLKRTIARLAR